MRIRQLPVGDLQANAYILSDFDGNALIIDPGDGVDVLLETLQRENMKLLAMLTTHGHFDHVMGAGEIQMSYNVPLYISAADGFLLNRMTSTIRHFLGDSSTVVPIRHIKKYTRKVMSIGSFSVEIIPTPGHTPGGVSLYFKNSNTIFVGDTLFADSTGNVNHEYSNKSDLARSISILLKLPKITTYYPGHGEQFNR